MISETTKNLLAAIDEIESLREELRKSKVKKSPMEKLNYRFHESTSSGVKMMADNLDMGESDIARTAIYIGLQELQRLISEDKDHGTNRARGMVHITKIRTMLNK